MSWNNKPPIGHIQSDAFVDLAAWEAWVRQKCPALFEKLDIYDQVNLYNAMCELISPKEKPQ